MTSHAAFFGDAEHVFSLPGSLIPELEKKTGVGIGSLSKRILSGDFRYGELVEIVRLGLIGGGMSPQDAAELVTSYADRTPVTALFTIAAAVIEMKFLGSVTKLDEVGDD